MDLLNEFVKLDQEYARDSSSMTEEDYDRYWTLYFEIEYWLFNVVNMWDMDAVTYAYEQTGAEPYKHDPPT